MKKEKKADCYVFIKGTESILFKNPKEGTSILSDNPTEKTCLKKGLDHFRRCLHISLLPNVHF